MINKYKGKIFDIDVDTYIDIDVDIDQHRVVIY